MAEQQVVKFSMTADEVKQLSQGGNGGITIEINYYDTNPAGSEIVARSTTTDANQNLVDGSTMLILCKRPCTLITYPPQP